ncbi:hypothetical protein D3C72_2477080 [compost metagenome]
MVEWTPSETITETAVRPGSKEPSALAGRQEAVSPELAVRVPLVEAQLYWSGWPSGSFATTVKLMKSLTLRPVLGL